MTYWNPAYAEEAELIAATVLRDCGRTWKPDKIAAGWFTPDGEEVQIAMCALMVARGECELSAYVPRPG